METLQIMLKCSSPTKQDTSVNVKEWKWLLALLLEEVSKKNR